MYAGFFCLSDDFCYSIILISFAGLPPTMVLAGTSLVTTAAAATFQTITSDNYQEFV